MTCVAVDDGETVSAAGVAANEVGFSVEVVDAEGSAVSVGKLVLLLARGDLSREMSFT